MRRQAQFMAQPIHAPQGAIHAREGNSLYKDGGRFCVFQSNYLDLTICFAVQIAIYSWLRSVHSIKTSVRIAPDGCFLLDVAAPVLFLGIRLFNAGAPYEIVHTDPVKVRQLICILQRQGALSPFVFGV